MKYVLVFLSAMTFLMQGAVGVQAQACVLEGVTLSCPGENDSDVLAAFATTDTRALLSDPAAQLERFEKPFDMETFRRSLEAVWKQVNRAERRERRRMRQGKISAETFEAWAQDYRSAEANYAAGLNFYRNLVWLGKTGKAPPKG